MIVEIYGRKDCRYCVLAKDECFKFDQAYTYKDVHEDLSTEEFKTLMSTKAVGAKTLPIVIVDDRYIGGYSELKRRLNKEFEVNHG